MVRDLVHNLCESLVENIDEVAGVGKKTPPTPITYLTQWKIVGNSEVHGVGNLTQWKVSGNSVVQDGVIMSCGDLRQDGKYHVKISNGVDIYDIALTEPLRKVNDIADTIEFPSSVEGKALVTRNIAFVTDLDLLSTFIARNTSNANKYRWRIYDNNNIKLASASTTANILCNLYDSKSANDTYSCRGGISASQGGGTHFFDIYDEDCCLSTDADKLRNKIAGINIAYELETPTTELVDAPQIAVSPTDTYTSVNVTPYSAFTFAKNSEIWSCGEYNPTDGKWHILVQPQGGSIADIALTEPLRKINDVADSIEYADGVATLTRNIQTMPLKNLKFSYNSNRESFDAAYGQNRDFVSIAYISNNVDNMLTQEYDWITWQQAATDNTKDMKILMSANGDVKVRDLRFNTTDDFYAHIDAHELLFILATPTTELVDVPQIAEAESYSMVISQGGKAVEWSSFETN